MNILLILLPLAQASQEAKHSFIRRALGWFYREDAILVQIPLISGSIILFIVFVLLVRLIRREQNLDFSYDNSQRQNRLTPGEISSDSSASRVRLRPARKRAISAVPPGVEVQRGPLRFGHEKEKDEIESDPNSEPEQK